uniref:Uncharacterized protein n=1 Tax=Plectus sambesii TaxID=2011161 RepID=A0A914WQD0_9BILA
MKSLCGVIFLIVLAIARPNEKNDYLKVDANEAGGHIEVAGPANELVEALEGEMHIKLSNTNRLELMKCLLGISVMENTRSAMEKETQCVLTAFRHVDDDENGIEKTRKVRQVDRLVEPLQPNQFLDAETIEEHPLAPVQSINSLISQFFNVDQNNTAVMSPNVAP